MTGVQLIPDSMVAENCRKFAVLTIVNSIRTLQELGVTDIDRDVMLAAYADVRCQRRPGFEQASAALEQLLNLPEGE